VGGPLDHAVYNGDASFYANTNSPACPDGNKDKQQRDVSSSTNPVVFRQAVIFTASVSASPGTARRRAR